MWREYEAGYGVALKDEAFVRWREVGARQKADNVVKLCAAIQVTSAIEIRCGTGAVLKRLQGLKFAKHFACVDLSHSAVTFARNICSNMSSAGVASATALPFRNAAFDVAILSHIMSNAIRRYVLRKSYALIEVAGHVKFWSARSIKRLLKHDCSLEILENYVDLISKEAEYFAKSGLSLAKPMFRQALKALLPAALYTRVLTSHSTCFCKRART